MPPLDLSSLQRLVWLRQRRHCQLCDEAWEVLAAAGVSDFESLYIDGDAELLARYPDLPITLTCMTPTGSERIQALFADEPRVQHCYLPYDLPCAAWLSR